MHKLILLFTLITGALGGCGGGDPSEASREGETAQLGDGGAPDAGSAATPTDAGSRPPALDAGQTSHGGAAPRDSGSAQPSVPKAPRAPLTRPLWGEGGTCRELHTLVIDKDSGDTCEVCLYAKCCQPLSLCALGGLCQRVDTCIVDCIAAGFCSAPAR